MLILSLQPASDPARSRRRRSEEQATSRSITALHPAVRTRERAPAVRYEVAVRAINRALNRALDDRITHGSVRAMADCSVADLPLLKSQHASWPSQVVHWQYSYRPKYKLCQCLAVRTIPEIANRIIMVRYAVADGGRTVSSIRSPHLGSAALVLGS